MSEVRNPAEKTGDITATPVDAPPQLIFDLASSCHRIGNPMNRHTAAMPLALGLAVGSAVAAAFVLQAMSGIPFWFEDGPLSYAQAILLGLLFLPCLANALHAERRPFARLFWGGSCVALTVVSLVMIACLAATSVVEPKDFDLPAALAWGSAAAALVLIERLDRPLGLSRGFLCLGFGLHCVAFLADFADGGLLPLSSISLGLIGSADEVLELLCLAAYFLGVTLLALNVAASSLWRTFDSEPSSPRRILAAAFNPWRAYTESSLAREASFWGQREATAAFLHTAYRLTRWHVRSAPQRLSLALQILSWPLTSCGQALYFTLRNGRAIRIRHAKGAPRQFLEQLYLAYAYSIRPSAYYIFDLYLDDRRQNAAAYLQRFETKRGLYRFIKQHRMLDGGTSPLTDKADFANRCLERGLPVVGYHLLVGAQGILRGARALPPADLFVKPNKGRGGSGAERWRYLGGGRYRDAQGRELDAEALVRRFQGKPAKGGWLFQPVVENAPELADTGAGVLATLRIITCLDETGCPEATDAAMRFPRTGSGVVDNFHAGGLASAVEIANGRLGPATDLGRDAAVGWHDRHPDSGARITGRCLPYWEEALSLASRAHLAFDTRFVVGWDLALLAGGWHLVEGNAAPDLDIIQRTSGKPLGDARFGRLLAFHAKAALRDF